MIYLLLTPLFLCFLQCASFSSRQESIKVLLKTLRKTIMTAWCVGFGDALCSVQRQQRTNLLPVTNVKVHAGIIQHSLTHCSDNAENSIPYQFIFVCLFCTKLVVNPLGFTLGTITLCHSRVQMGLCEYALSEQVLLTDLVKMFFAGKGRRNTYNKGTHSTYFGATCCFLSECIGILHHLHLFQQGSSATENTISLYFKRQYQHKSLQIQTSVGGIYLITSPLKYECGGCICNGLSCVLSRCKLSYLLFSEKAYLPDNGGRCRDPISRCQIFSYTLYHIGVSVRQLTW